ncbi:MAG: hypothetical protein V4622_13110 [Bacteroidota bacterium]
MIKYLMILSVLALAACNNSKTKEDLAIEAIEQDKEILQETIDSEDAVSVETTNNHVYSTSSPSGAPNQNTSTETTNTSETTEKKRMSNKTKGALIGAGAGIVGGAATGAAVSKKNKGKGAVVGGLIGGAVGAGVGYGIGAKKDNDTLK